MLAQNIISTISSWIPVSLFTILGVVAVDVFKYIVKNFLDYRSHKKEQNHQYELNLELERFKISWQENLNKQEQEFQSAMERMKYDFNRYAEDFNLYTTKRHESYLKIHQALLDAESQVLQLRGFIQIPDFSKYTALYNF